MKVRGGNVKNEGVLCESTGRIFFQKIATKCRHSPLRIITIIKYRRQKLGLGKSSMN